VKREQSTKDNLPTCCVQVLFFIVVIPFLPLLISWHWDWWEAWTYALSGIFSFAIRRGLVARRHPALIAERALHARRERQALG